MIISILDREENILGKGENAGNQHFLLIPHMFSSLLLEGCENLGLCNKGLKSALYWSG